MELCIVNTGCTHVVNKFCSLQTLYVDCTCSVFSDKGDLLFNCIIFNHTNYTCGINLGQYFLNFKDPQSKHLVNFLAKLFQELSWRYIYQKPGDYRETPECVNRMLTRHDIPCEEGKKAKIKTNCQQGERGKHLIAHSSSHALSRQSQ